MTKPRVLLCVSTLVILLTALPAMAQTNKATITGTVSDPNGAVVSGASVTVTNVNTGIDRKVTTGDDGTYVVPLLDIGTYKVAVTASGFKEVVRAGSAGGSIVDPVAVDIEIGIARPARLVDVPAVLVCRSTVIRH